MPHLARTFCCYGVLLVLLPLQALADAPLEIVPARGNVRQLRDAAATDSVLDHWHDQLYLGLESLIKRTDSYYANDANAALQTPGSPFRITLQTEVLRHGDSSTSATPQVDVELHLQMPNLQRKLQLFITSDNVNESSDRLNSGLNSLRAGVRVTPLDFVDFDLGVRADVPPVAFASLRWQKKFDLAGWRLEPFSKAYVETKRGVGWANGVNLERWFDHWVVRSASYGNWQRDNHGTEWTQAFIVARARDTRHAQRLYALGATDVVPETVEASLQLSEAVLIDVGAPMGLVIASIHERRDEYRRQLNRPEAASNRLRRARDALRGR